MSTSDIGFEPVRISFLQKKVELAGGKISVEDIWRESGTDNISAVEKIAAQDGDKETVSLADLDVWNRRQLGLAEDAFGIGWFDLIESPREQAGAIMMLASSGTAEAYQLLEQYFAEPQDLEVVLQHYYLNSDYQALEALVVAARLPAERFGQVKEKIIGRVLPYVIANNFTSLIDPDRYHAIDLVADCGRSAVPHLMLVIQEASAAVKPGWKIEPARLDSLTGCLLTLTRLSQLTPGEIEPVNQLLGKIIPLFGSQIDFGHNWEIAKMALKVVGRAKGQGRYLPQLFALAVRSPKLTQGLSIEAYTAIMDIVGDSKELLIPYLISSNAEYRDLARLYLQQSVTLGDDDASRQKKLLVISSASSATQDPIILGELSELRAVVNGASQK